MTIHRSKFIGFRVTPDELLALRAKAVASQVPLSEFVRSASLDREPDRPNHRSVANGELLSDLARIGNNLNQLTRRTHRRTQQGRDPELDHIRGNLAEVRAVLAAVQVAVLDLEP